MILKFPLGMPQFSTNFAACAVLLFPKTGQEAGLQGVVGVLGTQARGEDPESHLSLVHKLVRASNPSILEEDAIASRSIPEPAWI